MLEAISRRIMWIAVCLSAAVAGCASTPKMQDMQANVKEAELTLNNFRNDPEMKWFRENVKKARALLISPQIVQAGFIIGGSTGRAVAVARGEKQGWAGPAFYRISTGSIGLQAGAQASEMVALIMTEKALNSLLSTSFKLGGDVSIAAGPVGAGAGAPVTADMVVFTRSKGLYGGINLDGTVITLDNDGNRAYYGRPVTPVEILIKRSVSNPNATPLLRAVAMTAQ